MPYIFWIRLADRAVISASETTPRAIYVLPARRFPGFALRGWWGLAQAPSALPPRLPGPLSPPLRVSSTESSHAVSQQELEDTNRREQGYTPTGAITDAIQILSGDYKPKDKVWMYVNDFKPGEREKSLPTPEFPIVQSYVDICLTGCLQIEGAFPDDARDSRARACSSSPRRSGRFIGRTIALTRADPSYPCPQLLRSMACSISIYPNTSRKSSLRSGHWS